MLQERVAESREHIDLDEQHARRNGEADAEFHPLPGAHAERVPMSEADMKSGIEEPPKLDTPSTMS